jgi:glycosyltransferase involved in cell wall biosynthesis
MSPPVQIPSLCPSPFKIRTPAFLVVNAFSSDEPLEEILKAVARFPGYHFYVSGRKAKAPSTVLDRENEHIHFTDFLSENDYYLLMQRSLAVICLTTRDHTLQSGGEEALYMGKPLLTSDFRALREFFFKGTVFVQPEASSIADGVKRLTAAHRSLSAEMRDLQACYLSDWRTKQARLLNWLQREG